MPRVLALGVALDAREQLAVARALEELPDEDDGVLQASHVSAHELADGVGRKGCGEQVAVVVRPGRALEQSFLRDPRVLLLQAELAEHDGS